MSKFCTKCGKPIEDCICNQGNNQNNFITLKNYFGVRESDKINNDDCFEYGKKIVPDVSSACKGEILVKQYDVGRTRTRSSFSWGECRLEITNKRIIERCVGRSIIGKDIWHQEYSIDDIVGFNFSKGVDFSISDFLILFLVMLIPTVLGRLVGSLGTWVGALLSIASLGFIVYMLVIKKQSNNFLFTTACALSLGACLSSVAENSLLLYIMIFATVFFMIRYSLMPSVSFSILTKSMSGSSISMQSDRILAINRPKRVLPSKDTDKAIKELGAIITDIQKFGDFGAEKWQEECFKSYTENY